MNFKERITKYKKKSLRAKISDAVFIIFIVAMLTPSGRLAIGGFVNRIKAMIIQPSVKSGINAIQLKETDYNWELSNISGNSLNLSELKNKVIFINFWATWCPPCVGEMPAIQDLYNIYKDDSRIQFLMVTNDSSEKVEKFLKKRDYSFPVFLYKYQPPSVFKSSVIPTTFIISKDGKIMIKETGANNWNGEKTQKLIEKLITDK